MLVHQSRCFLVIIPFICFTCRLKLHLVGLKRLLIIMQRWFSTSHSRDRLYFSFLLLLHSSYCFIMNFFFFLIPSCALLIYSWPVFITSKSCISCWLIGRLVFRPWHILKSPPNSPDFTLSGQLTQVVRCTGSQKCGFITLLLLFTHINRNTLNY